MAVYPPYSTTFLCKHLGPTGPGAFQQYTVPVGFVAVVDSVSFVQSTNSAISNLCAMVDPTGSAGAVLFFASSFAVQPTNQRLSSHWSGRVAVRAGGVLTIQTLGSTSGYATLSGFLLIDP